MNIHRLQKGETEESLIVPLTGIRPSRVISLSFAPNLRFQSSSFDALRFSSVTKKNREKKNTRRGKEKKKELDRIDFSLLTLLSYVRTRNSRSGRYRAGSRNSPRYRFKYSYVGLKNGRNTIYYSYPYLRRYSLVGSGLYARALYSRFSKSLGARELVSLFPDKKPARKRRNYSPSLRNLL